MYCIRRLLLTTTGTFRSTRRHLLSAAFRLDADWSSRHARLGQLQLGNNYEWIAAIMKKNASGGMASAIDVDAAVCGARNAEQINDVVGLIYKLRHSRLAADMLESTSYSLIRLLITHSDIDHLLSILDDTINYGIFLNEHSACLLIDTLLDSGHVQAAAKVSSMVMQQEMFGCELLNYLALLSCCRWALFDAATDRHLSYTTTDTTGTTTASADDSYENEEDMRIFRYPYLKYPYFDGHFDLTEPDQLVGKSLAWIGRHIRSEQISANAQLLGWTLYGDVGKIRSTVESTPIGIFLNDTIKQVRKKLNERIEAMATATNDGPVLIDGAMAPSDVETLQNCVSLIDSVTPSNDTRSLMDCVLEELMLIKSTAEVDVANIQRQLFEEWERKRLRCIQNQTKSMTLQLRMREIGDERKKLDTLNEYLHFFENRHIIEELADENRKREQSLMVEKASRDLSDEEYAKQLFRGKSTKKQSIRRRGRK